MKKNILILIFITILFIPLLSLKHGVIGLSLRSLSPADSDYQKIYGKGVFYPELKLSYFIYKDYYLWAGYFSFSEKGLTPVLESEATSNQNYLFLGGGYKGIISKKFEYSIELGFFNVNFTESVMGKSIEESALGLTINGSIDFKINDSFSPFYSMGYCSASTNKVGNKSIKLGGLNFGLGLKFNFKL